MSFPSWERGLKSVGVKKILKSVTVVPLVGTWIEMLIFIEKKSLDGVVPLVGTWIEIEENPYGWKVNFVVPLVGTWIEID